ncbi:hypothetical protein PI125_g20306 [Phytophthora idaei]|nr:hypothetical protein PI125_g20306 [Phytophthora idaei]
MEVDAIRQHYSGRRQPTSPRPSSTRGSRPMLPLSETRTSRGSVAVLVTATIESDVAEPKNGDNQ